MAYPLGDGHYFDLLCNIDGWKTIQVKTGKLQKTGSIKFNSSSVGYDGKAVTYKDKTAIDYFAVYCPEFPSGCYLIPSSVVGNKLKCSLRVFDAKNNQERGILYARDYEI